MRPTAKAVGRILDFYVSYELGRQARTTDKGGTGRGSFIWNTI